MLSNLDSTEWDSDEKEILRENTAQSIHEHLESQDNLPAQYARRWIWELFQNALDAAPDGNLRIHLSFADAFRFQHNGLPFARKEILHLIFHGSTKREGDKTIGRYGTGFMTTHVLSRTISVNGRLNTGQSFAFKLDRTGNTPAAIMEAMETSRAQLLASLSDSSPFAGDGTAFEYPLSRQANDYVSQALSDLARIAIPVIAFNRRIRSIELTGKIVGHYELLHQEELGANCSLIRVGDPSRPTEAKLALVVEDEDVAIAVPLEDSPDGLSVSSPGDIPRLFVAFPLFGTESIPFPFLVNCPKALPNEDRSGLFLGPENREANTNNKAMIERSWQLFGSAVSICTSQHWQQLSRLSRIRSSPVAKWLDNSWLNSLLLKQLEDLLLVSSTVQTNDALLTPRKAVFPICKDSDQFQDVYKLIEPLYKDSIVRSDVALDWQSNLLDWRGLDLRTPLSEIDIRGLVNRVAKFGNLKVLAEALGAGVQPIDWLNHLTGTLMELNENWNEANILPNQAGILTSLPKLQRDTGIDEDIKEIAKLLQDSVRVKLLDKRIRESVQSLISPMGQEAVLEMVLGLVRVRKSSVTTDAYAEANARLLLWLINQKRVEELKSYPFLVGATGRNEPVTATPASQLLGAVETWPPSAQGFVSLFPEDHVLSSVYTRFLNDEHWSYLQRNDICKLDPVYKVSRPIDPDEMSSLIDDPQIAEASEHVLSPVEVSDVMFLNMNKGGILDSTRNSRAKSVLMLRFVIDHVLPSTFPDLEHRAVGCGCGKTHQAHAAAWLARLRETKWVNESRGRGTHVTSRSLARLVKEETTLQESLTRPIVFKFLSRLGVSPSELQRASLDLSDDQMAELERAMIEVSNATHNDPKRLAQIADLLASAPEMLAEFERRKTIAERVKRNMALGALVEQIFRDLFDTPEFKALGILLRRTGRGSDFAFENDFIAEGQENLFGIVGPQREILVELKATLGNAASMTPTQASFAVDRNDSFVLCVVPLEDRQPTRDVVLTNSRFVFSIGTMLEGRVDQVQQIRALQEATGRLIDGVQVVIQDEEYRYRVTEEVWNRGIPYEDFKSFLITFFQPNAASPSA